MQSKNKKPMSKTEREHVARVKALPCVVCAAPGPSEAHEITQGLWFLSVPCCLDCHRGNRNGIHGQKAMWNVMKLTEEAALNKTLEALYGQGGRR